MHEEDERTEITTLFPSSFATIANTRSRQQCSWICAKHFDKLVRQIVFGVREAHGDINTITGTLLRNGVGMVAASHIAPIVASNGGLLHQFKVPAHICNMVGLHDQTWFQIEPRRKLFITTRSSRQKYRCGSTLFTVSPLLSFQRTPKTAAHACCAIVAHVHLPESTRVRACTRTNLNLSRSLM